MQDLKKLELSAIHLKDVVLTDKILDKIRELIVLIIEEDMSNFINSENELEYNEQTREELIKNTFNLMQLRTENIIAKSK